MRTHTTITRALLTLVLSGCGGVGSGMVGICCGNGGNNGGNNGTPVLGFFVQPNTSNVGRVITPAVEIVVRDTLGSTDTDFTGSITVALASNSSGAALTGTTTVRPFNGIASFSNLAVDKVGTYTLQASTSGATTVTSAAFSITTATAP